jgi:23S rRNA (adenine2503-C2)-methyltransferase
VNLIPFTFTPIGSVARYQSSTRKGISAFNDVLERAGIPTTIRLNRGRDIQAACGQLAAIGASGS